MKISIALSFGFAFGLVIASSVQVSAQSQSISLPANATIDGPRTDVGSTGTISGTTSADPTVEVYPTTAKSYLNVRTTDVPTGAYAMGFRRSDGSVVQAWAGLIVEGSTFVIDIEKVETGILTFYIQVGDQELTASFYHVL